MINLISTSYYYIAIVFLTSESFSLFGDACTLVDFMNVLLQEVCGINLSFKRALPFLNGYDVRSKWSMWDVAVSVWSITASVLATTSTMLAVTAAVCATMSLLRFRTRVSCKKSIYPELYRENRRNLENNLNNT